jgi:hypothetical protein
MLVVTKNDKALRTPIRGLLASADRPYCFFVNIHDKPGPYMVGPETIRIDGHSHVKQDGILDTSFLVSPTAFFQTNIGVAREIVKLVIEGAAARRCGAAILDLAAADSLRCRWRRPAGHRGGREPQATRTRSQHSPQPHSRRTVRLMTSSVEEALPRVARDRGTPSSSIRERGCPPEVLAGVFRDTPARAVYVSCNPGAGGRCRLSSRPVPRDAHSAR